MANAHVDMPQKHFQLNDCILAPCGKLSLPEWEREISRSIYLCIYILHLCKCQSTSNLSWPGKFHWANICPAFFFFLFSVFAPRCTNLIKFLYSVFPPRLPTLIVPVMQHANIRFHHMPHIIEFSPKLHLAYANFMQLVGGKIAKTSKTCISFSRQVNLKYKLI